MSDGAHDSAIENLPPLRDVIAAHGLDARKALGQNFLLDLNLTGKIARNLGDITQCDVIEIGPGPGGLTRGLLAAGARSVHAIEFDERAINALQSLVQAAGGRLVLEQGDALKKDIRTIGADGARIVAANLPYNIATPLLVGWLRDIREHGSAAFAQMLLMFQREVAQRITAQVGDDAYGRLAVLCNWLCRSHIVMDLPPAAFSPPPKVHSSVVRFVPKEPQADWPPFDAVERVTAAAFGQRRKMLRSSMKEYRATMEKLGIDDSLRAENLPWGDYIRIAREVA